MPTADDLFRPTSDSEQDAPDQRPRRVRAVVDESEPRGPSARAGGSATTRR